MTAGAKGTRAGVSGARVCVRGARDVRAQRV